MRELRTLTFAYQFSLKTRFGLVLNSQMQNTLELLAKLKQISARSGESAKHRARERAKGKVGICMAAFNYLVIHLNNMLISCTFLHIVLDEVEHFIVFHSCEFARLLLFMFHNENSCHNSASVDIVTLY